MVLSSHGSKLPHRGACLLAALALAVAACILPATDAVAEPAGTLTVASDYDHVLTAYHLLSGSVSGDSLLSPSFDGAMDGSFYAGLSGLPQWTAGQDAADPATVRDWLSASIAADTDYAVAGSIAALAQESGSASVTLRTNAPASLGEGYWLVTGDDTLPFCVLVGTGPVTAHEKASVPTVDKGVSKDGGADGYHESVTAGSAERLSYRVRGTLPVNYNAYDSYVYRFVDTSSKGIEVDIASIRVVATLPDGSTKDLTDGFSVSYADHTLTVATDNLKSSYPEATGDEHIDFLYEADLDPAEAELGYTQPNTNSVTIQYSNSPHDTGIGTTEPSRTKVYSFGIRLLKADASSKQPLAGAEFSVCASDGRYLTDDGKWSDDQAQAASLTTGSDGRIEIGCLGPGTYVVAETKAPEGYAALEQPVKVTLDADQGTRSFTIEATSTAAQVSDIDAEKGTATLTIENSTSKAPTAHGGLPDTGDMVAKGATALALLAAGMLLLRLSHRIRRQR